MENMIAKSGLNSNSPSLFFSGYVDDFSIIHVGPNRSCIGTCIYVYLYGLILTTCHVPFIN